MSLNQYGVVVIGAGPAGGSPAINAAKHGKRVVVIDGSKRPESPI